MGARRKRHALQRSVIHTHLLIFYSIEMLRIDTLRKEDVTGGEPNEKEGNVKEGDVNMECSNHVNFNGYGEFLAYKASVV